MRAIIAGSPMPDDTNYGPPISFAQLMAAFAPGRPGPPGSLRDVSLGRVQQVISRTTSKKFHLPPDHEVVREFRLFVEYKLLEYLRRKPLPLHDDGRPSYGRWLVKFTNDRIVDELRRIVAAGEAEKAYLERTEGHRSTTPEEEFVSAEILARLPAPIRGVVQDQNDGLSRDESATQRKMTVGQVDECRARGRDLVRELTEDTPPPRSGVVSQLWKTLTARPRRN